MRGTSERQLDQLEGDGSQPRETEWKVIGSSKQVRPRGLKR